MAVLKGVDEGGRSQREDEGGRSQMQNQTKDFYFLLTTLVDLGGGTLFSVAAVWTNNSLTCQLYSFTLMGAESAGGGREPAAGS